MAGFRQTVLSDLVATLRAEVVIAALNHTVDFRPYGGRIEPAVS